MFRKKKSKTILQHLISLPLLAKLLLVYVTSYALNRAFHVWQSYVMKKAHKL